MKKYANQERKRIVLASKFRKASVHEDNPSRRVVKQRIRREEGY